MLVFRGVTDPGEKENHRLKSEFVYYLLVPWTGPIGSMRLVSLNLRTFILVGFQWPDK